MESQKIRFEKDIKMLNEDLDEMDAENSKLQKENSELKFVLNSENVNFSNISISSSSETEPE